MTVVLALIFARSIGPLIHEAVTVKTWVPLGTPFTTKEHPEKVMQSEVVITNDLLVVLTCTIWFKPYGLVT